MILIMTQGQIPIAIKGTCQSLNIDRKKEKTLL